MDSTLIPIPSDPVPANYIVDPSEDIVIPSDKLVSGMVVVHSEPHMRGNPDEKPLTDVHQMHVREGAYWAEIIDVEVTYRLYRRHLSMTCRYADGTEATRKYFAEDRWIVKKTSILRLLGM